MDQLLELDLSEKLIDMTSVDLSKCPTVFEDGVYDIRFECNQYMRNDICSIEVHVNGNSIGNISINNEYEMIEGLIEYKEDNYAKQPFLLHYDLVLLSFILIFADGSSREYFSDFLLCVSKNPEDVMNIQKMIQEIIAFDDTQVGEWIFSDNTRNDSNSLYEGKWNKQACKSLSSYIQLLENVISCYKNNYAYFKMQSKHTIKRSAELVSYENVKTISRDSFNWIVQNTDQLAKVPYASGIQYQGKNYLPYHIATDTNKKSWDVYENRVVLGFLYTALLNAKQVYDEFDKDVLNEARIISRIQGSVPKEYRAPIITIKTLHVSFCRNLLKKLRHSIETLQQICSQYVSIFDIPLLPLTTFPRKTNTFCEIKPYSQIFEIIVHWLQYGEYSLEKERLILQVKTLDKLYEYYCLLRLLQLLADNGYTKNENIERPVSKHLYTSADSSYQNERDVANTYKLIKGDVLVTLYFQPVISAVGFENDITLFKTRKYRKNYYTPDFVLKFSSSEHNEEYVIFDAKFSSRKNIIEHHRLDEVIQKYSCEMAVATNNCAPRMVWIFQGRVNNNENAIWRYHNSPLTTKYRPITSYGIVSLNTTVEISQRLWNEIKNNISFLV